jgi:O-phosphoseryl-tRNA(Cys) synthetase
MKKEKQAEEKLKILAEKAKSLGFDKILLFVRIDNMAISKIVGFEDTEIIEALFKLGQEFAKQCNVGLKIEKIDDNITATNNPKIEPTPPTGDIKAFHTYN